MEECNYKTRVFMAYRTINFVKGLIFFMYCILPSARIGLKKNELLTCSLKAFLFSSGARGI